MSRFTPKAVVLEQGKEYYFCNCGKGSDKVPSKFSVNETKEYYLCTCKKSSNLPFCDGSHTK